MISASFIHRAPVHVNYQNDPEAPEVTGLVVSGALKQLRCGVLEREARRLQRGAARRTQTGKTKVYNFEHRVLALVCKQHVLWGGGDSHRLLSHVLPSGMLANARRVLDLLMGVWRWASKEGKLMNGSIKRALELLTFHKWNFIQGHSMNARHFKL